MLLVYNECVHAVMDTKGGTMIFALPKLSVPSPIRLP